MGVRLTDLIKRGKKVFSEDECAPDAESTGAAWQRLFGEPVPKECLVKEDHGDCMIFLYPQGRVLQVGPPKCGWNDIYVVPYCACVSDDAERCLMQRLSYMDAMREQADGGKCDCACHREYLEDIADDGGEL